MNKGYIVNVTTSRQPGGYSICIVPGMNARTDADAIDLAVAQVCLVEECSADDCEIHYVESIEAAIPGIEDCEW